MPSRLGALFAHHVTHRPNQLAFRDLKRSASYSELWLQAESLERSWPRTDALVWIEVSDPFDAVAAIVTCWRSGRNYGLLTTGERPPFAGLWHQRGSTELLTGASPESINGQLIVFSTSGTTGRPVFVAHSDTTLLAALRNSLAVQAELLEAPVPEGTDAMTGASVQRFATGSVLASGMSLATISGATVLHRGICVGDTFAPLSVAEPAQLLSELRELEVVNAAIPVLSAYLLRRYLRSHPTDHARTQLVSLGLGGAAVTPGLAEDLEQDLRCLVSNGYGSTELGGPALIARVTDAAAARHGGVGTPLPGVRAQVDEVDAEGWGRLRISSPSRALGILHADGSLDRLPHGPYDTGDIARENKDGTFVIAGRADELIIRGGKRIDPTPIRARLLAHPKVRAAVVCGIESRISGEQDIGAVVAGDATPDELRHWLAGHGSTRVRAVAVVTDLPRARDGNISISGARALLR